MRIKKKIEAAGKMYILSIVILVFLSSMGLGYGNWATTINYFNDMHTGDLKTEFKSCALAQCDVKKAKDVNIEINSDSPGTVGEENNVLSITLKKSSPDCYSFNFAVNNSGTIPVECIPLVNVNDPVSVTVESLPKDKKGYCYIKEKDYGLGTINITVGKIDKKIGYKVPVELVFYNNSWTDTLKVIINIPKESQCGSEESSLEQKLEDVGDHLKDDPAAKPDDKPLLPKDPPPPPINNKD